ncbi:MAG: hypothetical protein Edafosvirus9_6 [Edafosvirus sp.]|uniref:Uncharacterized protein n=1 Tax=Edafosvirus sp. TaxID=2487765 RepID=A0A3G4ZTR3_9VIRU|nr:MAG: hypothetical protein Edafosvirus9_6 [Edafosvirus sp.]
MTDTKSLELLIDNYNGSIISKENDQKIKDLNLQKDELDKKMIEINNNLSLLEKEKTDNIKLKQNEHIKINNIIETTFNNAFKNLKENDYVYFRHRLDTDVVAVWTKLKIIILDRTHNFAIFDNDTNFSFSSLSVVDMSIFPRKQRFVPIIDNNTALTEKMIKMSSVDNHVNHFINKSEYITVDKTVA